MKFRNALSLFFTAALGLRGDSAPAAIAATNTRTRCRTPNQSGKMTWSLMSMVGPNTGYFRCRQKPWIMELHNVRIVRH